MSNEGLIILLVLTSCLHEQDKEYRMQHKAQEINIKVLQNCVFTILCIFDLRFPSSSEHMPICFCTLFLKLATYKILFARKENLMYWMALIYTHIIVTRHKPLLLLTGLVCGIHIFPTLGGIYAASPHLELCCWDPPKRKIYLNLDHQRCTVLGRKENTIVFVLWFSHNAPRVCGSCISRPVRYMTRFPLTLDQVK